MDNRPIGVFDSGVGGLTGSRELCRLLPGEDIIYFGDSGRAPYGGRPAPEIREMARQNTAFVLSKGVKALLVACGTMDSNAMSVICSAAEVPVCGVVEPAARAAAAATKNGRVGVIATEATAKSDAYGRAIARADRELTVLTRGCPLLVPMVEAGRVDPGDGALRSALREYLSPLMEAGVDTLLLGCTHYPLLAEAIAGVTGPGVKLIDSAAEGAGVLAGQLRSAGLLAERDRPGMGTYYTSGDTEAFRHIAGIFLGRDDGRDVRAVTPLPL